MPYQGMRRQDEIPVIIRDNSGNVVNFTATTGYNFTTSTDASDTVDLARPGYLWINSGGVVKCLLLMDTSPVTLTFESAGVYPITVKRIYATDTTVATMVILN